MIEGDLNDVDDVNDMNDAVQGCLLWELPLPLSPLVSLLCCLCLLRLLFGWHCVVSRTVYARRVV